MDSNPKTICLLKYLKALKFFRQRPAYVDMITALLLVTGILCAQIENYVFLTLIMLPITLVIILMYYVNGSILSMMPLIDEMNIYKVMEKQKLIKLENLLVADIENKEANYIGYGYLCLKDFKQIIFVKFSLEKNISDYI
ncbi:hypothetical protein COZ61_01765 [Candidatus Berkelbacteria bacterium CG_4_8_14_3_um_filter_33_6]|uniref:Uncharacterized protein n=1 Tax=Candidatus Berkelbacteria bacterium CG_4_10_14_0_2_um_filter_35_9_33_12 TaxID=1974499 RepID=A0A2M7W4M2_9BACT|nr:MAG: hypothetical protein COX10_00455 [Candidatus Berkelbacteria bacterium CG23_combo_of_CG06-09_8_20_14_all_33_15]PIS08146.1 MAG: hypothetical protein COT76_03240 [Candidatus Berkelbacteria bacterium CG10_big_fil_rev_8_21_14_0_10_33_10]PIX31063.1 MAG: hypothetical protein COZ61_01765 [Candidatus Berkelbacteria bacterium CG_4_8_14_3_um_filter_33_6]PIZ28000.1 MAG: hypothetical protein COY43_02900 [Candidatus Berkelbacteria bacterium CG_4_10_14_0_8_um_filter_35_9_33_8]PJA20737.1 MAG: hypotheti